MHITRRSILLPLFLLLVSGVTAAGAEAPEQAGAAAQRKREVAYIQRFLAAQRLPLARPGVVQTRDGWVYELRADRFILARVLGKGPDEAGMRQRARGELVWFRQTGGGWVAEGPAVRTRPAGPGALYFQSHILPVEWAAATAPKGMRQLLTPEPGGASMLHYFTVLQCELTPVDSPEFNDPVTWELPAWFANARMIEAQFRKGTLGAGVEPGR